MDTVDVLDRVDKERFCGTRDQPKTVYFLGNSIKSCLDNSFPGPLGMSF